MLVLFLFSVRPAVDDTDVDGDLICCKMFGGADDDPGDLMPSKWTLFVGVTVVRSPPPPTVSLVFCMASNIISSTFCGDGFSDGRLDLFGGKGNKLLALKGIMDALESLGSFDPLTSILVDEVMVLLLMLLVLLCNEPDATVVAVVKNGLSPFPLMK